MNHYEFNDAPDKPLVNLAYANGFPPETYRFALEGLFPRYYVLSLHSRPLWGDCPPESLTSWAQLGDDLLTGLKELTDNPVIGIGHSVGGVASMYAAVKEPERFRALVLIEPTLIAPPLLWAANVIKLFGKTANERLAEGALRRRRTWDSVDAAYQYFKSKRLFERWPDVVIRAYAESITMPAKDGVELRWTPEWEAQIYRKFDPNSWRLPGKLTVPTLVIRGSLSDTFTSISTIVFRLRMSTAKISSVAGAGHLVAQEKPEITGSLIADFIATLS